MSTVPLKKPIKAHDKEVTELTFREPTTEDYMDIGVPQLIIPTADGKSAGVEIRPNVIGQYISRLAGIPMSSVKQLGFKDFNACSAEVMGFFNGGDD